MEINLTETSLAFYKLMAATYPKGFTDDDGKLWREPVAMVTGSKQITGLGPAAIQKNPIKARDFATTVMTSANNNRKTGIAMRYCIEKSPLGNYPQLNDYIKDPDKLKIVFRESINGQFAFNRGYSVEFV